MKFDLLTFQPSFQTVLSSLGNEIVIAVLNRLSKSRLLIRITRQRVQQREIRKDYAINY